MESTTAIADIANRLKLRKNIQGTTALFLGAKTGGLFRSSRLYNVLSPFGQSNLPSLTPLERYREYYKILCAPFFSPQDIYPVLTDKVLLQEIKAEVPELCVAELSKRGFFNPILSVSMYREFEEAFQQLAMRELEEFVVVWPKKGDSLSLGHAEKRAMYTFIKVFGDIAAREYNVNQRTRYLEENEAFTKRITDLRNANILIVGADKVWDQHVFKYLFPHSAGNVWYVNDEEPARDSILLEYLEDCKAEFILGPNGQYESFFKDLYLHLTRAIPPYQAPVVPKTSTVPAPPTVITEPTQSVQYHSCFISYSSKDEMLARRLHDDLQEQGVRCWFAPEDLKIGEEFRPRIDEAIDTQDKLLLLLSEHSIASTWVKAEVEAALEKEDHQKRGVLFPIRLDDSVMQTTQAWAALLRRTRHIGDFTHWTDSQAYQQAFDRLLRDLKA